MGRDSSVGIATDYGLDGPGMESRWVARFSAPVQTGPGAHPASYTMGTGSFPGVKSGQGLTLTPQPLLLPWSRKSRTISLLTLWAARLVQSLSASSKLHFRGADKSLARSGRKQANVCQNGENFLRRLALQEKNLDDSSRLDVVEIARVPDMLPSLFPSWSG